MAKKYKAPPANVMPQDWRLELADLLDALGTREGRLNKRPVTFHNLDELVFKLRKAAK